LRCTIPDRGKLTHIDTCFTPHHLIFAEDANNTLWLSGGGARNPVVGWVNTKKYFETGDEQASQNWTAFILETKRQRQARRLCGAEPAHRSHQDKRIVAGIYGIGYDPNDGSILGLGIRDAGRCVAYHSGRQSSGTRRCRNITKCRSTMRACR